jgi:hypothetical protein
MKLDLANRSTTDLVVLTLTVLVSIVLVLMIIFGAVGKIIRPELDMARISEAVNQTISAIVGALIGFIGGRAYGRAETLNGPEKSPPLTK